MRNHWLSEFLYSEENFALIAESTNSGWLDGGCLILADALVEWLGEGAELYFLCVSSDGTRDWPEHALVRYGDLYLDGDGASSEGVLLQRWEEVESLAGGWLMPATTELRTLAREGGIPDDAKLSLELAQRLKKAFPVIPWPKEQLVEMA